MLKFSSPALLLLYLAIAPTAADAQVDDPSFPIGPSPVISLAPNRAVLNYSSELRPDQKISIEHDGSAKGLKIRIGEVRIDIKDRVFKELTGSLQWLELTEFQLHLGDGQPPLHYLQLSFTIFGNDRVSGGSIEICRGKPIRLRLEGADYKDRHNIIYDSAISDDYILDGVWEEIKD